MGVECEAGISSRDAGPLQGTACARIHTLMGQISAVGSPTTMFLGGARKPENQEEIHTDTVEHVKHLTDRNLSRVAERQQRYLKFSRVCCYSYMLVHFNFNLLSLCS